MNTPTSKEGVTDKTSHEAHPDGTQPGTDAWDNSWNVYFDFGSPKSQAAASTLRRGANHTSEMPQGSTMRTNAAYSQWLTVPSNESDVPPGYNPDIDQMYAAEQPTTRVRELQRQIDELRAVVSSLANKTGQNWTTPDIYTFPATDSNGDQQTSGHPRPLTPFSPAMFDSFSFAQSSRENLPPQGHCTPMQPLSTFDLSDDSPVYSRRGSATSIGSVTARRGQRVAGGYPCTRCEARFDLPSELRHHERKHLSKDERPHACVKCGDRFLYPKDVVRHDRQVHTISRPVSGCLVANDCPPEFNQTEQRSPPEERKQRRRHAQQFQVLRGRRTEYIKQLESTLRTLSSTNRTTESRRDSAIADMDAVDADPEQCTSLLHQPFPFEGDHVDFRPRLSQPEQDMPQLQQALREETAKAEAARAERDAFAEIFSRTAVFPGVAEGVEPYRCTTMKCAKGWLGAIEALLTSAELPDDTHESHVADAVKLLASALDHVGMQETAAE